MNDDQLRKQITEIQHDHAMVVLYFSNTTCGACHTIKAKVQAMLADFPKVVFQEIESEKHLELTASYSVFSFPLLILMVEGKETQRFGRNLSMADLERLIERYYGMLFPD